MTTHPAQHLFAQLWQGLERLDRRKAQAASSLGPGERLVWHTWRWLRGLRYGRPSRA